MILRQKARNQFLFLVRKLKHDRSCRAKKLALTFWWPSTNKIKGTQHHHKLILHPSCQSSRVLVVTTKVEQGKIRVGKKRLLVITDALIATTFTQKVTSCNYRWYLFLLHWIIQSSIHTICPRFVNIHPALHRTLLVITGDLIARAATQRATSYHHWCYLFFLRWMIQ